MYNVWIYLLRQISTRSRRSVILPQKIVGRYASYEQVRIHNIVKNLRKIFLLSLCIDHRVDVFYS